MVNLTRGRIPSLLAWGFLVGGVALLITFPEIETADGLFIGAIPAALLFALAGFVFGLSHPEGAAWAGAALLGWLPAAVVTGSLLAGREAPVLATALLVTLPPLLAAAGSGLGAGFARWRRRR